MTSKNRVRGMIIGLVVVVTLMLAFSVTTKNITAAGTFTVSNTMDSGSGSLRQAIMDANAAGGGTIDATGVSGTIDLLTELHELDGNITINGPGAATLTVEPSFAGGTPDFSVFTINSGHIVVINGLTIKNVNTSIGGGIFNNGSILTVNDSTFTNNTSGAGGGIFHNGSTLTVNNSTFIDNTAEVGGGIFHNGGTLTVNNSTFTNNTGDFVGGGIFHNASMLTVSNSTFINNTGENGGGIFNNGGTMTASNSTFTNNTAATGGGIYNNAGTVNLQNTIVAKNTASDVAGSFISAGHNLIGDTTGSSGGDPSQGDLLNVDPRFEVDGMGKPLLKDNGGVTETIALLCGSPAIDRGKNLLGSTTDQRGNGFARTFDDPSVANATGGDGTDIGAFEGQQICFDTCLQNDGGNAFLQINSLTGDYLLCCGVQSYVGKGTVTIRGSVVTLQDNSSNRRVQAKVDRSTNRATASLQLPLGSTLCTISDRDIRNNACLCQ